MGKGESEMKKEQMNTKSTSARVKLIPLRVDVDVPEKSEDGIPVIKVKDLRAWAVSRERITNKALRHYRGTGRQRLRISEECWHCR